MPTPGQELTNNPQDQEGKRPWVPLCEEAEAEAQQKLRRHDGKGGGRACVSGKGTPSRESRGQPAPPGAGDAFVPVRLGLGQLEPRKGGDRALVLIHLD